MINKYTKFIFEHKLWGKNLQEFIDWMESKSNKYLVFLDTETTGLRNSGYEVQLTQIACIIAKYDSTTNTFSEVDSYDKKIKLTPETSSLMTKPGSKIKNILSFNHYGKKDTQYHNEKETLSDFYEFLKPYSKPLLVIQNAEFDMTFLNTRNKIIKFDNEVLDTKQVVQLYYIPALQKLSETDSKYTNLINKIGTSDRDNGLISSSLSKIGPALGINMSGYHDALVDCRLMIEMLEKMLIFFREHTDLDISKYQIERINTKK